MKWIDKVATAERSEDRRIQNCEQSIKAGLFKAGL